MTPTLFTFGYWGWGSSTEQLVSAVDRIERSRGFRPPFFVDLRLRRSVRARGFSGDAFAHVVGHDRYLWMPGLGNRAIVDGGRMRLAQPEDAAALLRLILLESIQNRRIITFCACIEPIGCHRRLVGREVLAAAERQRISLNVVEWPGTAPTRVVRRVDATMLRSLQSDAGSASLAGRSRLHDLERGWYSVLHAVCGSDSVDVPIGPAQAHAGGWRIPLVADAYRADKARAWKREAERLRQKFGYVVRTTVRSRTRR